MDQLPTPQSGNGETCANGTCIRGNRLCPEAERLWRKANNAYAYANHTRNPEDWKIYDQALQDYYNHFSPAA